MDIFRRLQLILYYFSHSLITVFETEIAKINILELVNSLKFRKLVRIMNELFINYKI